MATLDGLLAVAELHLGKAGHPDSAAAVAAARKELRRLMVAPEDGVTRLEVGSIVSTETGRGIVELVLNSEKTQMSLDKAREVLGMLSAGIEAAISDELLFRFLTDRVGLPPAGAGAALVEFREMRQGSRETVYPT